MEYILIVISAIFVNNVVLSQFLGICPFLGVSKKVSTAAGMGAAVTFVLTLATIVTYLVQKCILEPFDLKYLQTIAFILIIAALVQMVEIILKKVSPSLYQALGVFLPLITTNCCILGVAIMVGDGTYNAMGLEPTLLSGVVYAIATAIGFALALILFAGVREHLELMDIPEGMKGMPIALIVAGIMALAFIGFSGLV
ncbi:MAG: electron transport complex protein RnfA [Bacteroidales bacterium]|nr:electron transport complex protein RnfA [Bacteroidales bacterium]